MDKVYCLRCVKPAKLERRGAKYYCGECCASRSFHFYGNQLGFLTKVAQDGKNHEVWKRLSSAQVCQANELDFN